MEERNFTYNEGHKLLCEGQEELVGVLVFHSGRGWAVQAEDTALAKVLWPLERILHLYGLEEAGMAWQPHKVAGARPPRACRTSWGISLHPCNSRR